jgi:hypothetical protein
MLGEVELSPDICCRFFTLRTVAAPSIEVGPATVTPMAKRLAVRGPGFVIIRSRPTAVQISANGQVSRVRIRDMTRVLQALVGFLTVLWISLLVTHALGRKEEKP